MMILVISMIAHTSLNVLVRRAKEQIAERKKAQREYETFMNLGSASSTKRKLAFIAAAAATPTDGGDEGDSADGSEIPTLESSSSSSKGEDDPWKRPRFVNKLAQIIYVVAFVLFQSTFWFVALTAYFTPPETFLDTPLF